MLLNPDTPQLKVAKHVRLLVIALVAVVFGVLSSGYLVMAHNAGTIVRGVKVGDLYLGGKTALEAEAALRTWQSELNEQPLVIRMDNQEWKLQPIDLRWHPSVSDTVKRALAVGREGTLLSRWQQRWRAATKGVTVFPESKESSRATQLWLNKVEATVYQAPQNAYRDLQSGVVKRAKSGRQIDIDASIAVIQKALASQSRTVLLVVRTLTPHVTYDEASRVLTPLVLARFSTRFNPAVKNRVVNIRTAAAMINGIIVQPGQVFSFNEVVGPRLEGTGYRSAPELLRGDLVPGIGGGVCQVSSTLYNAVLFSNMSVIERYKHSAVLGYVAAGRDATVSYGQLDFRFRNTLDQPIVIRTFVEGSNITISLLGSRTLPYRVKLTSENKTLPKTTVEKPDTTLLPGKRVVVEEGKPGQYVVVRKEVTSLTGKLMQKSIVSKNLYQAQPTVVRVGAARISAPAVTTTPQPLLPLTTINQAPDTTAGTAPAGDSNAAFSAGGTVPTPATGVTNVNAGPGTTTPLSKEPALPTVSGDAAVASPNNNP